MTLTNWLLIFVAFALGWFARGVQMPNRIVNNSTLALMAIVSAIGGGIAFDCNQRGLFVSLLVLTIGLVMGLAARVGADA